MLNEAARQIYYLKDIYFKCRQKCQRKRYVSLAIIKSAIVAYIA